MENKTKDVENQLKIIDLENNNNAYKMKYKNELIRQMKIEDDIKENQYQLCCGGSTDARVLTFLSKFLIIFSTLIFSFVMILLTNDSAEKQVFIVLVNTILAVFLPSPQIKDKKDKNK